LKWDKIPKANYAPINFYQNFDEVVAISKNRIAQNQEFLLIDNYAKWLKESRNKNSFSLNYKDYLNDQKKHEKRIEEFKDVFKHNSDLAFTSPLLEIALTKKDTVLASKRKAWHEDLSKDIYIDEAIQVLSELKVSQNMLLVKK
jgi:carboxyl-terminal processing protease